MTKTKEKNTNSQFAIDVAEGFYQTGLSLAKLSNEQNTPHGYIWIPAGVVNFSFATELLLKATIYYDLKKRAWGHKLFDLYQTLSKETKCKIEDIYTKYKEENKDVKSLPAYRIVVKLNDDKTDYSKESNLNEIKNLLLIHSDSFENWRYIHEFGEEGYCYEFNFKAMDAFYKALKDVLKIFLSKEKPTYGMKRV